MNSKSIAFYTSKRRIKMLELKKREDQFLNEAVYFGTHESGVKVYIMPKGGYNKQYAILITKYGSVDTEF